MGPGGRWFEPIHPDCTRVGPPARGKKPVRTQPDCTGGKIATVSKKHKTLKRQRRSLTGVFCVCIADIGWGSGGRQGAYTTATGGKHDVCARFSGWRGCKRGCICVCKGTHPKAKNRDSQRVPASPRPRIFSIDCSCACVRLPWNDTPVALALRHRCTVATRIASALPLRCAKPCCAVRNGVAPGGGAVGYE